jgi:hypothetical protein
MIREIAVVQGIERFRWEQKADQRSASGGSAVEKFDSLDSRRHHFEMRFTLLPDPRFRKHASALTDRLEQAAKLVTRDTFGDFADELIASVLEEGFYAADGDEGTLWLVNPVKSELDAVFNNGPTAEKVLTYSQSLDRGLISMVFSTGHPFCENNIIENPEHDKTVDLRTGSITRAMIAVPFYFAQQCRGILSCVQLAGEPRPPTGSGFNMDSMREVSRAASLLTRLFDFKLISQIIGYGHY